MLFLRKIYRLVIRLRWKLYSNEEYARKVGVNFGKNAKFLTREFGSEPYLINIGDDFYTSGRVRFVTHDGAVNVLRNIYSHCRDIDSFETINIGNNVFIGFGSIILPGTNVGDNVIVGAGSLVRGELKSNSVYGGVPVKYLGSIESYLERNNEKFVHTRHFTPKKKEVFLKKKYLTVQKGTN